MNTIKRQDQIRSILENQDFITVEDLVDKFNISPATARRDLVSMEENGIIERFPGGAKIAPSSRRSFLPIQQRLHENPIEKTQIAMKAASLIQDGDIIFMDSSSTVYLMLDYISANNIMIVTNSILVATKAKELNCRLYILNGNVEQSGKILCDDPEAAIRNMNFAKAFVGVYGITQQQGQTTLNMQEGEFKKVVFKHTQNVYTLSEHQKFGKFGFCSYAPIDHGFIITDEIPEEYSQFENIILSK